jgi:3-methylfumaryl-CoA hydratase
MAQEPDSDLQAWRGRSESTLDTIAPTPLAALAATLDQIAEPLALGSVLPPLWHWLFFLPRARQSELGPDGHALRGGFLPPVSLPRRMWAGSRFEFRSPLHVGDVVERRSTIAEVTRKQGRNGPLVFVGVRHELRRQGEPDAALVEFHDIVYREARRPADVEAAPQAAPTPSAAAWTREIVPDEVLLFRYSALTFNGHRIHYDRRYAVDVEGYPGLVVHGPLIATLLMDLLCRHVPGADVATFRFRLLRPSFDGRALRLGGDSDGRSVRLWAADDDGWLTMDAVAALR